MAEPTPPKVVEITAGGIVKAVGGVLLASFSPSIVRTGSSLLAGAVLALLTGWGVTVDEGVVNTSSVAFVGAGLGLAYYILVRIVETKFPWAGVLLGWPTTPTYIQEKKPVVIVEPKQ